MKSNNDNVFGFIFLILFYFYGSKSYESSFKNRFLLHISQV